MVNRDVKEPTHPSLRVGNVASGLAVGLDIVYTVYIFKIPNKFHNIADSERNLLFVH